MPLSGLERGMRHEDPEEYADFYESLAVLTLGALVRRGEERATELLRRYVGYGKHWHMAIEQFRTANRPDAWQGLDDVLDRRFSTIKQIEEGWPYLYAIEHAQPPWSEWKAGSGLLASWLRAREENELAYEREVKEERRAAKQFPAMTTDELLDYAGQREYSAALTKELARRTSPDDVEKLLASIDAGSRGSAVAALAALRESKDDRVFEAAVRTIEAPHKRGRTWKQRMVIARPSRQAAFILLQSDPERTLPLARAWRSARFPWLRQWAYLLLKKHATTDDIDWVRKQLSKPITDGRIYQFCDLAEIVTRFPSHGPFPQLVRLYYGVPYSFARYFILPALAVTSPRLARESLFESLWDCEPTVRRIACEHADLAADGVRERLRELANDPFEEDDVRKAAKARLNA